MDDVKGLNLRLPKSLLDELREIAALEQRSINNLIVVALGAFAREYEASKDVTAGSPPMQIPGRDHPDDDLISAGDERTQNGPGHRGEAVIAGEGGSVPTCAPSDYRAAAASADRLIHTLSSADTVSVRSPAVHQSTPSDGPATARVTQEAVA